MARRARKATPLSASCCLLAVMLVAALLAGCGDDGKSSTKNMDAQAVAAKVKPGMTEAQVTDALGEPSTSYTTGTGANAKFVEYDSKQGVVAVTIARGVVSNVRALGTNDSEKPTDSGGDSGAENVPHQFGN